MPEPAAESLRKLIDGFRLSQALYVIATLRIPDVLADGPQNSDELAAELGCRQDALYRVLRFVAAAGILHEDGKRRFSLTPLGEPLRTDAPGSLAAWARLVPRPYLWETWGHLLDAVRSGENAFHATHGMDVWEYRKTHPEEGALFDAAMTARTLRMNESVAAAYDFGRFETVVDVGGGHGALLRAIVAAHPSVRGILVDQPHVIAKAEVGARIEAVGGDFFRELPGEADAYVLKWVLHDWEDDEAQTILETVTGAAKATTTVLVVERILPPPNEGFDAKLTDLQMLMVTGGRERTREEFAQLFARAGLRYRNDTPADDSYSLIEAVPA